MKTTVNSKEKEDNGFKACYVYIFGNTAEETKAVRKELRDYCMENRLLVIKEVSDTASDEGLKGLLYSVGKLEKKSEILVMRDIRDIGEGYDGLFHRYILGTRGFMDIRTVIPFEDEYEEMMKVFVRKEKEIRTDRVWLIKKNKIDAGYYCGGRLPYGYYTMNGKLFIDKYESFVVKFIFYRKEQGCSEYGIMKELNLRGFHNRKGKPFMTGSIYSILKRKRFYQGYLKTYDGGEVKGNYTPLLLEGEHLLSEEFVKKTFDKEIEERIANSKRRVKEYDKLTYHITPFLVETPKGEIKRGRKPQYEKPY